MITVFFRTDTVEASQEFDADKASIMYGFGNIEEGILTLSKEDQDVAQFNSSTWIFWYKHNKEE